MIRKLAFIIFLIVFQKLAAQTIPTNILEAFNKDFPNAEIIYWSQEEKNFNLEFVVARVSRSVLYTEDAKRIEIITHINEADCPESIRRAISEIFKTSYIISIGLVEKPSKPKFYQVYLEGNERNYLLKFDYSGRLLHKIPLD